MSCYYDASSTKFLGDMMQGDMQTIYQSFLETLPEKAIILDAGCGSGRDSLFFKDKGHMIFAMDTSEQICQMASEYLGQSVLFCRFQDAHFKVPFDGIWACASMIHLSAKELEHVLDRMYWHLKDDGVMYVSFIYGDFEGERDGDFYLDLNEERATQLFSNTHFSIDKMWTTIQESCLGEEIKWLNIIARK